MSAFDKALVDDKKLATDTTTMQRESDWAKAEAALAPLVKRLEAEATKALIWKASPFRFKGS